MKLSGLNCDYRKLTEYLYWTGEEKPVLTESAKNKIMAEVKAFIKKANEQNAKISNTVNTEKEKEKPDYNFINKKLLYWSVFSFCINSIIKKVKTGEYYFDFEKFERDIAEDYIGEKARNILYESYLFHDSPEVKITNNNFSWVATHLQCEIQTIQYYENGQYFGNMDINNNKRHGKGTYTWKNGDKYDGQWENGGRYGKGTYVWANGEKYTGMWYNSQRSGKGVMHYKNGSIYEGVFKNNKRDGFGKITYRDGAHYHGLWKNDNMSGVGKYYFANGEKYFGELKNGNFEGFGVRYYNDGSVTFGYFENDNATYNSASLDSYNDNYYEHNLVHKGFTNADFWGENLPNLKQYGILIFNNGDIYVGEFCSYDYDGYGCMIYDDGQWYKGQHKYGKRHGEGSYHFSNGQYEHGQWKNGESCRPLKTYSAEDKLLYELD